MNHDGCEADRAISRRTLLIAGGAALGGIALTAVTGTAALGAPGRARAAVAVPSMSTVTVWSGDAGAASHRIPAILVTASGTVVAAAEARIGVSDPDPHEIVVKRSIDGGATWSAQAVIEAAPADESWCNPTFVQDRNSGRLFLFYNLNIGGDDCVLYVRHSDDDGATWSSRTDLTPLYAGNPDGWTMHSPGPGHGLQLEDGRLLMQVWHRRALSGGPEGGPLAYGVSVLTSDDGGATWLRGGNPPVDASYPIGETRLIERADGVVVVAGRYAGAGAHSRIVSASPNRGATWAAPELMAGIPTATGVDAGLLRSVHGGVPRTYFSWLNDPKRKNLTLSISYDDGVTFPVRKLLLAGNAGYSDVATLADGTILVIHEVFHELKLIRANLEWVTEGADSVATGPGIERDVWPAEDATIGSNLPGALTIVGDAHSIGARRIEFAATATGDHLDFPVTVGTAGDYEVSARLVKRRDRGRVQFLVDGVPVGGVFDGSTSARSHPLFAAGTVPLSAGPHTVRLEVVGKSASSTGYRVGVDYVALTRG